MGTENFFCQISKVLRRSVWNYGR